MDPLPTLVSSFVLYDLDGAPLRRRGHAGTRTARTLLAERLLGTVMDFLAILLLAVSGAGIGLIRHHYLMHQRLVEVPAKQCIRGGYGGVRQSLIVDYFKFHVTPALRTP